MRAIILFLCPWILSFAIAAQPMKKCVEYTNSTNQSDFILGTVVELNSINIPEGQLGMLQAAFTIERNQKMFNFTMDLLAGSTVNAPESLTIANSNYAQQPVVAPNESVMLCVRYGWNVVSSYEYSESTINASIHIRITNKMFPFIFGDPSTKLQLGDRAVRRLGLGGVWPIATRLGGIKIRIDGRLIRGTGDGVCIQPKE